MPGLRLVLEVGIVRCTCGKMRAAYGKESTDEQRQLVDSWIRFQEGSIPRCETRTNSAADHVLQHSLLRKVQIKKNGCCKTILERWQKGERYRKSSSQHGWTEEQIRQWLHLKNEADTRSLRRSL